MRFFAGPTLLVIPTSSAASRCPAKPPPLFQVVS